MTRAKVVVVLGCIVVLLGAGISYIVLQRGGLTGLATGFGDLMGTLPKFYSLNSQFVSTPPDIDGTLSFREWLLAERLTFDNGYISVLNDEVRLYILINVEDDIVENKRTSISEGDYFWVTFDVDGDGDFSTTDLNFRLDTGKYNLNYARYCTTPGMFCSINTGLIRSSVAAGFDCFIEDGSYTPDSSDCSQHRVWELAIDLREIGINIYDIDPATDKIKMGIRVVSQDPLINIDIPDNFQYDFSNLISVTLEQPDTLVDILPGFLYGFDEDPDAIEVTQAIQSRENTLSLVSHKPTVARIFPFKSGPDSMNPTIIYLYGKRNGNQLPGSPLSAMFWPKESPVREKLYDTLNFSLPDSWLEGTVEFRAKINDFFGFPHESSTPVTLTFEERDIPVYWIIPVKVRYDGNDYVEPDENILKMESYLETVYPVPEVDFVWKSWWTIGSVVSDVDPEGDEGYGYTVREILDRIEDYYFEVTHASSLSDFFVSVGSEPFRFPDQIFGAIGRCGQSSPVRSGGSGHAACGDSSDYTTMAHEINHNLDRRDRDHASWGLHVCNPDDRIDSKWSCGSDGCDMDWADQWSNCNIQEVGFDTRLPWRDGYEADPYDHWNWYTVMQGEYIESGDTSTFRLGFPDFMTYCKAQMHYCDHGHTAPVPGCHYCTYRYANPLRWISPYRWQILFDQFEPPPSNYNEMTNMCYVSGTIYDNGSGELDHVFNQPGLINQFSGVPSGDYSLEGLDKNGNALFKQPLEISFLSSDLEDSKPVHHKYARFHTTIPSKSGYKQLVIRQQGKTLDSIIKSPNAPQVKLLTPNGGEMWKSQGSITWSASDKDNDSLRFTVIYSPDKGKNWHPIAWNIDGSSYKVDDTSLLPGTQKQGLVRVVCSDGFNTTQDDSDGFFSVQDKDPTAFIIRPENNLLYEEDEIVHFQGRGYDADDLFIPDENYHWSYNGYVFAVGKKVTARLPYGVKQVELTVYDSDGNYAEAAVYLISE